jgi:hypothetical protein
LPSWMSRSADTVLYALFVTGPVTLCECVRVCVYEYSFQAGCAENFPRGRFSGADLGY